MSNAPVRPDAPQCELDTGCRLGAGHEGACWPERYKPRAPRPAVADSVKPLTREELEALAHAYRYATPLKNIGAADSQAVEIDRESLQRLLATARAGMEGAANVTRFEVIDHRDVSPAGRVYSAWDVDIELSYQDDRKTLKVFVADAARRNPGEDVRESTMGSARAIAASMDRRRKSSGQRSKEETP